MRDHLSCGECAEPPAFFEGAARREPKEEARGEEIARARRIDELTRRDRVNGDRPIARDDERAFFAPREDGDAAFSADRFSRLFKARGLIERGDLGLIREEDIDMSVDEIEEALSMALDAKGIGEGEGDLAPMIMSELGGAKEGSLCFGAIPKIALKIGDARFADEVFIDLFLAELGARAEEGVHRALCVARHKDDRARGWKAARGGACTELDTDLEDLSAELFAEGIICHAADESASPAKGGDPSDGIRSRTARADKRAIAELCGKRLSSFGVDERHGPFMKVELVDERVVDLREHIYDRVSDAEDIVEREALILIHARRVREGAGLFNPFELRGRKRRPRE